MKHFRKASFVIIICLLFAVVTTSAGATAPTSWRFYDRDLSGSDRVLSEWDDGTWEQFLRYKYYPNGTIKTAFSNHSGWPYEGHYDPQGHLMDSFRIWYIGDGYVEGIPVAIYENNDGALPDADDDLFPVREYDTEGRLTHFETPTDDARGSFLIKIDYEYDDQNRISRLTYEYDLREESDDYCDISVLPSSSVFEYSDDGSYTVNSERSIPEEGYSFRRRLSYDADHHLICYEDVSSNEHAAIFSVDRQLFEYNEDGFLTSFQWYEGYSEDADVHPELREDTKYNYRWEDDHTLICDFSYRWNESEELSDPEYFTTFLFDEEGRVIQQGDTRFRYD